MTCVSYGGGPSLEQRREFSNLKEGSHIPGYLGFCPQLKYNQGKTYGQQTHELAQKLSYFSGAKPMEKVGFTSSSSLPKGQFGDEKIVKNLPKSTGYNKLTENMVPGYSGDIPHWKYKFGYTYKNTCDECIDEFIGEYNHKENKKNELLRQSTLFPAMDRVKATKDPKLRDHINLWTDNLNRSKSMITDRKAPTEHAIPGYCGFIPRINVTELGLGARYKETTERGYTTFFGETSRHGAALKDTSTSVRQVRSSAPLRLPNKSAFVNRLYEEHGMVPRYTGYLPGARYNFGHTYGNMTRSLDVCSHPYANYGQFVRSKREAQA